MTINIFLAILPVLLGWIFYLLKNKTLKIFFGISWLVFLPNSIYLFTDLINMIKQWGLVNSSVRLVFIFQYGVLVFVGYITYILSVYPFEKFLTASDWVKKRGGADRFLVMLNFLVGFGITLGRTERINSWEVLSAPLNIVTASLRILLTPELLFLTILFGLFANTFYFLFRTGSIRYFSTYLSQAGFLQQSKSFPKK